MDIDKSRQNDGMKDTNEKKEITLNFISIIEQLLKYSAFNTVINKVGKKGEDMIQIFFYMISEMEKYDKKKMVDFIEYVKTIDFSISPLMVFELVKDSIRYNFPEVLAIEYPRYRVQAILLGEFSKENRDSYSINILTKDNFYFKKNEETPLNSNDIFPNSGIFPSRDDIDFEGFEDVCIFDIEGNMVFWGDLSEKYITNLNGTYYVLNNSEGMGKIPKFAKKQEISIKLSTNKLMRNLKEKHGLTLNIPTDLFNIYPDSLRAMAKWKILGGQVLANSFEVKF